MSFNSHKMGTVLKTARAICKKTGVATALKAMEGHYCANARSGQLPTSYPEDGGAYELMNKKDVANCATSCQGHPECKYYTDVVESKQVRIYQDVNPASGWNAKMPVGEYRTQDLVKLGAKDNDATLLYVPKGLVARVFSTDNFASDEYIYSWGTHTLKRNVRPPHDACPSPQCCGTCLYV